MDRLLHLVQRGGASVGCGRMQGVMGVSEHPLSRGLVQFFIPRNTQNDCHQWLSVSSRVHQIHFRPGPRLGPTGEAYSTPPGPPSWLKGALLLRGGEAKERRGRGKGDGREGGK